MQYDEDSPFYKLLATKYKEEEEDLGIAIVESHPEIAPLEWPGPDEEGQGHLSKEVFALHYAANDGIKIGLSSNFSNTVMHINASNANWYRSGTVVRGYLTMRKFMTIYVLFLTADAK